MDRISENACEFAYRRHLRRRAAGPSRLEILKASIKTVSKEYCEESSICGLKHLVDENTPVIERIIWSITIVVGLIGSVSLVWVTFNKYYSAPLVTTQSPEGVSVSEILFPAVGICTNNRISKRAATDLAKRLLKAERNKNYTEDQMMSLLYGLGQLYWLGSDIKKESTMELHYALGEYDVHTLMRSLTPKCEHLLVSCVWDTSPVHCLKLFDFRLTMNGYCCTFNYLRLYDSIFQDKTSNTRTINMYRYGNKSSFDFDQGLKVLLRLNESDDFFYNIPLQGAQLQFSDAYDFPDSPSGSFAMQIISPSVEMTVMVTASITKASRDIQHVPIKLRKCRFYDESSYLPFYTYSDCMLKCRMEFLLDNCNCTPFNMPKMEYVRTCNMKDVPCLQEYYAQSISVRPNVDHVPDELELESVNGGIYCPMCYPTCSKTDYSYDFHNVLIYPEYLNNIPNHNRDPWLQGVNYTGTSLVNVRYARDVADCYGQNVIMKWFDLISNIGSTCGFITGFSFVSVLEFIYFFTIKLMREIRIRRQRVQNNTKVVLEYHGSGPVEPMKRYRPIYWNEITPGLGPKST
ncbi:sodium channel protein Nach-like [Spodoptera litura]|uniref:Sodium channel protein Nach-like n=1 Tax=Spodoptera litura TaxID=69820 RepID=A0A9J7J6U8_SPOLT|nr:sodium channel protein Nach-like [Spodoptera litura]